MEDGGVKENGAVKQITEGKAEWRRKEKLCHKIIPHIRYYFLLQLAIVVFNF